MDLIHGTLNGFRLREIALHHTISMTAISRKTVKPIQSHLKNK
jgi:hypothetical protein